VSGVRQRQGPHARFDTPPPWPYNGPRMNRVKLWLFTLLAVGAGTAWLYAASRWVVARSIDSVDARLQSAKALAEARSLLSGREVTAIAGLAARDPALGRTLAPPPPPPPPPPLEPAKGKKPGKVPVRVHVPPPPVAVPQPPADPLPVAEAAARAAAEAAGLDPARGMVAGLVRFSRISLRSRGQDVRVEGDAAVSSLLETARDGRVREALIRIENAVYHVSVAPVPAVSGVALVVGVPPDIEWIRSIRDATGVEVTLPAEGKPMAGEAKALLDAVTRPSPAPLSVGKLAPVKHPDFSWAPLIPLLFTQAPAWRALGIALPGIPGTVVLSRSTRSLLEPWAIYQQMTLLGLAGLLLLGLVFGFLVKNEPPLAIPKELLQAADRIAHGEFDVRAPALAGQLGTIADALNHAAEAATGRPEGQPLEPSEPPTTASIPEAAPQDALLQEPASQDAPAIPPTDPFFAAAPPPSSQGETTARDFFAEPGRATALFSSPAAAEEFLAGEPLPAAAPPPVAEPALAPAMEPPPPPVPTAPAPGPAAPAGGVDEEHWHQVYEEFLLIRRQCGEPADGLTYEKFRQKLLKNRDSLIEKYGCKVVRFQAYVKDGKAALKATPVR
jgi:hypothetical protein